MAVVRLVVVLALAGQILAAPVPFDPYIFGPEYASNELHSPGARCSTLGVKACSDAGRFVVCGDDNQWTDQGAPAPNERCVAGQPQAIDLAADPTTGTKRSVPDVEERDLIRPDLGGDNDCFWDRNFRNYRHRWGGECYGGLDVSPLGRETVGERHASGSTCTAADEGRLSCADDQQILNCWHGHWWPPADGGHVPDGQRCFNGEAQNIHRGGLIRIDLGGY